MSDEDFEIPDYWFQPFVNPTSRPRRRRRTPPDTPPGTAERPLPVFGQPYPAPPSVTNETGSLRQVPADDAFVAPIPPPRIVVPPKVPTPTAPPPPVTGPPPSVTGPSPADAFPRQLPIGRSVPVAAGVLRAARDLSVAGVLSWVWTLAFGPSFGFGWRERSLFDPLPQPTGPPRRTRRPGATVSPNAPQPFWDQTYRPGYRGLPGWLRPIRGPFPLPGGVDPSTRSVPDVRNPPRAMPTRPRTLPGGSSTVSPVLAPAGWTLGDPIAGPGYDPFTYTPPPSPAPHAPPRAIPRSTPADFPWPDGFNYPSPFGNPRVGTRPRTRPLTPQPTPRAPPRTTPGTPPRAQPTPRPQPPPGLTPFNTPEPQSQPQYSADPCGAAANTAQREKRRRRKECKRFTTKTIRVCADKRG